MKWPILVLLFSSNVLAIQPPNQKRQQQLSNLFKHDCGSCHGLTMKGGLGSPLLARSVKNKTDVFLVNTILEGRKGTAMPPWKPFITEEEAFWIVRKLIRLQ